MKIHYFLLLSSVWIAFTSALRWRITGTETFPFAYEDREIAFSFIRYQSISDLRSRFMNHQENGATISSDFLGSGRYVYRIRVSYMHFTTNEADRELYFNMAVATLESHMIAQVANLPNSQRTGNFNIYSDTRCQDSSMRAIISYSIIRDANPAYKKRQLSDAFLNSTKDNFDPLNEYQIPNPSLADMVLDDVAGVKDPDYKSGGIGFEVVNMAEERPISIKKRQMPDASLNSTKERLNSQNERQTPRASLAKMVLDDIRGVKDRRYKSGGIGFERANMTEISHSINFSPKALEKRSLFKRQSGLCLLYTDLRPLAKYHYQCSTRDTLISRGMMLGKGQDRWTGDGLKRLYVHENGNVCLWHYPNDHPTMYWCWDHGKDYTKDADFRLYVIPDGRLCVNGDTGNYCSSINKTGLSDSFYRLTLQNDGNLVMYRGVFESILWATMSNRFNVEGPTPCTNA